MGKSISKTYKEQKKAIEEGEISFDLNLYFIGEEIELIYDRFKKIKSKEEAKGIFSFWNFLYHKGEYATQLKVIGEKFLEKQKNFEEDPIKNTFKEVVIAKFKERDEKKIEEILDTFASGSHDVYCPFIIFFFDDVKGNKEKVIPDENNYYISPMKVFTYRFDTLESETIKEFHNCLFRICSYYNELGDQFPVWPENGDPFVYDLINQEFNSYINIFCLGKTGSGKSTFLNQFFREKKSKQGGTGTSTTKKVIRFGINNVPLRIYDIPGFEGEETIEIVKNKLIQTSNEMTTDKDKIHLILYFINNKEETIIYEMEKTIIETLKANNKDIRILFIMTHSLIDPYTLDEKDKKNRRTIDAYRNKMKKCINVISSIFGESYSYQNNYFEKDKLIQDNLIFVNLEKDFVTKTEPFGFDKVIKRIYQTLSEGNEVNKLIKLKEKLANAIINKVNNDPQLDKELNDTLSKGYLMNHISFSLQKEKAIAEAQKLYDNMFSIGMNLLTISPILRDVKISAISYHKMQFKKKLNLIFGFHIPDKNFDDPNETSYEKNVREYLEKIEKGKKIAEKDNLIYEVEKDINAKEVSSSWIFANEAAGFISYMCLFGGPVTMAVGVVGIIATSKISYEQFKKDCTEYFEQYKKHYEEFRYYSLYNFINCIILGIDYLEAYITSLDDKAAPDTAIVIDNLKKEIEKDFLTAKGNNEKLSKNEKEVKSNIPFMN